jgi:hypothetical protein
LPFALRGSGSRSIVTVSGTFVVGEPAGAEIAHLVRRQQNSFLRDDEGVNPLAENWVWTADDGAFHDSGEADKHILDLGTEDLEASAVDHVFAAIEDPHETIDIDRPDISPERQKPLMNSLLLASGSPQ